MDYGNPPPPAPPCPQAELTVHPPAETSTVGRVSDARDPLFVSEGFGVQRSSLPPRGQLHLVQRVVGPADHHVRLGRVEAPATERSVGQRGDSTGGVLGGGEPQGRGGGAVRLFSTPPQ